MRALFLEHSIIPSILETCSLPAEENVMLFTVTNQDYYRRWKIIPHTHCLYFSPSTSFVLNLRSKQTKKQQTKPTRKDCTPTSYISFEETKLFLHAHGCQVPSFQSLERRSITRRTYLCDSVGCQGSALLLYPGLYRLQIAGPAC